MTTAATSALPLGSDDLAATTIRRLRSTFDSGVTRSAEWRVEQLDGLLRLVTECRDDLADAVISDLRRAKVDAILGDLTLLKGDLKHARKNLREWMAPVPVKTPLTLRPAEAWYQYEPLGVTVIIAPWNYPILLALSPLVAALAAGNCAVVKPSELTPACSSVLASLLPRYLDPDAVAVVEGGAEASLALLDQAPDHCFFTGSPRVGKAIATAAAAHLTPVTLELGGKSPVVVTASAALDVAARRIANGKLMNSGQACVAPDYVLVERSVKDQFVALLTDTIRTFSEGRPVPLLSEAHAARLRDLIASSGAGAVHGGAVDVDKCLVEPCVVVDPEPGSALMQEEIFGPVLPVVTVDSLDDAIAHIRRGERPLASYLFSEDPDEEERFLAGVISGGTVINHVMLHLSVPDLPFGGIGQSGSGRYHGQWGFDTFSHARAVLRKKTDPDRQAQYPPRSPFVEKVMLKLL